jgi:ferredoxin
MACVVCEPCHDCKYTDCVTVCPMDCFYQDEESLYIDPDACIDCDACISECPVAAIFRDINVPKAWIGYIELNARRSRELKDVGSITQRQEPKRGANCKNR